MRWLVQDPKERGNIPMTLYTMQNKFLSIQVAKPDQTNLIISFFKSHLRVDDPAIYSEEFLCRSGVITAIRRKNVIITCVNDKIVGACRFYRKRNGDVSLYQFAISKEYRGQHLLLRMLEILGNVQVNVKCPSGIDFNDYYKKTGWSLERTSGQLNQWVSVSKDFLSTLDRGNFPVLHPPSGKNPGLKSQND